MEPPVNIEEMITRIATGSGERVMLSEVLAALSRLRGERDGWKCRYDDIAQRCDPAGDMQRLREAEERAAALEIVVEELRAELGKK